MDKENTTIDEQFVHRFIEVLSQKAEEVRESFGDLSQLANTTPFSTLQQFLFPNQDMRAAPIAGVTPPVLGPSGFDYEGDDDDCDYLYGFTNSEFMAFLGKLCPSEFLTIVTLISILIAQALNKNELALAAIFLEGLGDQLELLVEYDSIQSDIEEDEQQKEQNKAIQQDFNYIFQQLCQLQEQVKCLQQQLGNTCK